MSFFHVLCLSAKNTIYLFNLKKNRCIISTAILVLLIKTRIKNVRRKLLDTLRTRRNVYQEPFLMKFQALQLSLFSTFYFLLFTFYFLLMIHCFTRSRRNSNVLYNFLHICWWWWCKTIHYKSNYKIHNHSNRSKTFWRNSEPPTVF